jgi:hypothetical protein
MARLSLSSVAPTGKPRLDLDAEASLEKAKHLGKLEEFIVYVDNNRSCIVNYGDRYRHGEPIASGFVESAVNQVVSKRFVKRQQMAWPPRHAHNLLQIRTAVLNDQFRSYVERWYPSIAGEEGRRLAAYSKMRAFLLNPVYPFDQGYSQGACDICQQGSKRTTTVLETI